MKKRMKCRKPHIYATYLIYGYVKVELCSWLHSKRNFNCINIQLFRVVSSVQPKDAHVLAVHLKMKLYSFFFSDAEGRTRYRKTRIVFLQVSGAPLQNTLSFEHRAYVARSSLATAPSYYENTRATQK